MNQDLIIKVIVIGEASVGKTCLVNRYIDEIFENDMMPTIGVDIRKKDVIHKGQKITLSFLDTAGQERFQSLTNSYYKGANACIIVYDLTVLSTFVAVDKWYNKVKDIVEENIPILIVGNKSDIDQQREVSTEQAQNWAEENGCFFIETSSKNGKNVNEAMNILVQKGITDNLLLSLSQSRVGQIPIVKPVVEDDEPKKKDCC